MRKQTQELVRQVIWKQKYKTMGKEVDSCLKTNKTRKNQFLPIWKENKRGMVAHSCNPCI